ncbi:hypothetical protein OD917_09060 [Flavobacterium sp. SH_e]|uniref:hypothetical protein n=1 Tax=Flavobacterium TaxID=237 RepID=UPI0021E4A8A6|nr:hypothetical protein [Flavobacterium sp. SH_e]MCV2485070.1 hypothetical protein [Flavobacterium sp. SH_e]
MESSKINIEKSECSISNTKIYYGDNDELICVKVYQGDWGNWDEKPEKSESISNENIENDAEKL